VGRTLASALEKQWSGNAFDESAHGQAIWDPTRKGRQCSDRIRRSKDNVRLCVVVSAQSAHEGTVTKHRTADNEMSNEPNYKQGQTLNIIV
jgi:hypothetical protein